MCHFDTLLFWGVVLVLFSTARRLVLCFVLVWSVGRSVVTRCTWSAFWCAVLGLVVILCAPFLCLASWLLWLGVCPCSVFSLHLVGVLVVVSCRFFFVFCPVLLCFLVFVVVARGCFFLLFYGLIFENKKRKKTPAGLFPLCCAVGRFHRFYILFISSM